MKKVILSVLLVLFSVPFARAEVFRPKTFILANGLKFVVVENRLAPVVAQMVWYKVGASDEEEGKTGLAHYLEHLMFKGTDAIPAGEFSRIISSFGGKDNAFTSYDYTAYYEIVSADRLAEIMQMEADRMQNLKIDDLTAATELKVVISERQERTTNDPQGIFAEKLRKALFPKHPYGRPIIGFDEDLQRITPEDARGFYARYYAPQNAVVVISGDVDFNEVMRLAAGTYGRVMSRGVSFRKKLTKVSLPKEERLVMKDKRIIQPRMSLLFVVPSCMSGNKKDSYVLEVLAEALGGGEVGELYRNLVVRKKMASVIDVKYDPDMRGPSVFTITATPGAGVGMEELEKAIIAELKFLAKRGVSSKEIAGARERLERAAIFARDSVTAPANILGQALAIGQKIEDVENWPKRIKSVTSNEVNKSLKELVVNRHRIVGILAPEKEKTVLGQETANKEEVQKQ